jgi:cytochrome c551/c552
MKRLAFVALGTVAVASIAAARFGGWAIVSIDTVPEHGVVGKPVVFDFSVRQHGQHLLEDLKPEIVAKNGSDVVTGRAWETPNSGVYRASVNIPKTGDWAMTIRSGFMGSELKLLPLKVVGVSDKVAVMQPAERGRQLFAAKGCVSCHVHNAVGITPFMKNWAPDLTDKRFARDYLEKFLADPSIKPPTPNIGQMPNMHLRPVEIASLVAFINAEQRVTSR